MVGRTARLFRDDALKPQPPQIQLLDEDVDRPHRIVFSHVIVKELGQQNALRSVLPLHKALHQEPRLNPSGF
jgi:hypothetical protein